MRPILSGILLLTVSLAGCVDVGPGGAAERGEGEDAQDRPVHADASLTGCVENGAGRLVSFDHLKKVLPDGYEAADASGFFGMPQPTGAGVVLSGHLKCEHSVLDGGPVLWSDLIVYIHPPEVPGVDRSDGRIDLYQLAHFSTGALTIELLRSVGFAADLAEVTRADTATPIPVGSSSTVVDGEQLLAFEVAAAAPQPYSLFARFWHDAPNGTAYFEHDRGSTMSYIGGLAACRAAAGSVFAEAFGVTECTGTDALGGLFPEPADFDSTFHYLPGVHAVIPG